MSSRQLRKLQQQRELEQAKLQAEAEVGDESEEEPIAGPQKAKPSLFANLAALEDEDGGEADADKEEVESAKEDLSDPEPNPTSAAKSRKPKKKKKKAKNKAKEIPPAKKPEDEDEIEEALRQLNVEKSSGGSQWHDTRPTLNPEYERVCALLGIQIQYLKVANEMRNLFGKTALENHDDAGGPVGRAARRHRGQQQVDLETALKGRHPPGRGLPELVLRRNCFIQGKDEWPKATTGGLTMEVVDSERNQDGTVLFKFVHDKTYQALQLSFHQYVEMGDPQNLIGLLIRNRKSLYLVWLLYADRSQPTTSLSSPKSAKSPRTKVIMHWHRTFSSELSSRSAELQRRYSARN